MLYKSVILQELTTEKMLDIWKIIDSLMNITFRNTSLHASLRVEAHSFGILINSFVQLQQRLNIILYIE